MSKARELQEKFKTMHEKIERPSADWSILYSLNKGRVGKNSLDQNKNEVESLEKLESYIPQNTLGLLARSIARKQLEKELE